nr:hypothetical protein [Tanacetum cinerariifolium]
EDAYDSDVDEGPHASAAFMANLSSTGDTNGSSSSHINEAVPTVVSADEADNQSMIAVLQRMHTKIADYVRVNDEHKLVNATLTAELERCKIEMQALESNKVKHDLDMAIVEQNKQNAELEEENAMLKSTLKSKVVSIENLQQESKQVLSEKKTLEDKYLKEIVVLTNANKVATNVLKGFQMSTHTISMLSKRPNFASHDLHKTGLGYSNRRVHDSEESLVHAEVCMIKMAERPWHALPINYAKLNALYVQFVPQKELSREQVYWLPATEIASQSSTPAKPVAPFMHTRPVKSDVQKKLKEQLQGRDDSIRNLKAQNDIMSLLNVGSTDDSCNKQALETELTQLKDTVTSLKI